MHVRVVPLEPSRCRAIGSPLRSGRSRCTFESCHLDPMGRSPFGDGIGFTLRGAGSDSLAPYQCARAQREAPDPYKSGRPVQTRTGAQCAQIAPVVLLGLISREAWSDSTCAHKSIDVCAPLGSARRKGEPLLSLVWSISIDPRRRVSW